MSAYNSPCFNCEKRKEKCHNFCAEYANYKSANAEIKKKEVMQRKIESIARKRAERREKFERMTKRK